MVHSLSLFCLVLLYGHCTYSMRQKRRGPFNLNGRNGRTTAGVDLHTYVRYTTGAHIPSFLLLTRALFF